MPWHSFRRIRGLRRSGRWLKRAAGLTAGITLLAGMASSHEPAQMPLPPVPSVSNEDFMRSDRFLLGTPERDVLNGDIALHWIDGGDAFYYRSQRRGDTRFLLVDCATGRRTPLFDHRKMASALGAALNASVSAAALPIEEVERLGGSRFKVSSGGREFRCDLSSGTCDRQQVDPREPTEMPSPDRRYSLFSRDYNLWIRDNRSRQERPLTRDGVRGHSYGTPPESSTYEVSDRRSGERAAVAALWAPDSRHFVSYRLDERHVPELALVQGVPEDGTFRPKVHVYHYDVVGDEPALAELFVYDIQKDTRTPVNYRPLPSTLATPLARSHLWWSADSRKLYLVDSPFEEPVVKLLEVSPESGQAHSLLEERSDTTYFANSYFLAPPSIRVLANGDIIWFSERTGWGHLYRYDGKTGRLKNAITRGEWLIRDILGVDERGGYLYVSGSGREAGEDVYNRHLYRVRLDGSGLQLLTPERGDHDFPPVIARDIAAMSPIGKEFATVPRISPDTAYVIDHFSTPEAPGHWILRRRDGSIVVRLEDEDPAPLPPYTAPETFVVQSADGRYALYGVLSKPADFDPTRRYPVIDYIYPGPQIIKAPKGFASGLGGGAILGDAQALADLGFVVIQVDGRGGPFRSKAFRDLSYGHMEKAGTLEDHIASLRQLGQTRPWLDLRRVGIFGTSGGGFATVHALIDYPDFFKVGVASAGNHEQRSYLRIWGETYHGPTALTDYDKVFAGNNGSRLAGKLLLAHGDMDDNVHPANTLRLAGSLIEHDKQFDMLIMPNVNHGIGDNRYFQRVRQNYFLKHLMGAQLPSEVDLVRPGSPAKTH